MIENKYLDPQGMVEGITEELNHFRNEAEQSDDIEIMNYTKKGITNIVKHICEH